MGGGILKKGVKQVLGGGLLNMIPRKKWYIEWEKIQKKTFENRTPRRVTLITEYMFLLLSLSLS